MKNEVNSLLSELKKINEIEKNDIKQKKLPKRTQLNIILDEIKILALKEAKEEQQFDDIKELAKKKYIENIKKEREIQEKIKIDEMYYELNKQKQNNKIIFNDNIDTNFNSLKLNNIKTKIDNKKNDKKLIIVSVAICLFITCFCFSFFIFKDTSEEIKLNVKQVKLENIKLEKKIFNSNKINIQIFPFYVLSYNQLKQNNYYDLFLIDFLYFSNNEILNKNEKNKIKKINKTNKKVRVNFDLNQFDIK